MPFFFWCVFMCALVELSHLLLGACDLWSSLRWLWGVFISGFTFDLCAAGVHLSVDVTW